MIGVDIQPTLFFKTCIVNASNIAITRFLLSTDLKLVKHSQREDYEIYSVKSCMNTSIND